MQCIEQNNLKIIGILICLNTGMRLGKLCALRWENIDLTEKNSKVYNVLKVISKKYGKECFFLTGAEKCIEPRSYQSYFEKLLTKVKIKKRNFHATRHTMASNCIEVGMDIKTLSKILGHASVQITMNTYVHSSKKQMRKYLDKL